MSEKFPGYQSNENSERAQSTPEREGVRLELPGILGRLPEDQKKEFDDLMFGAVIPWAEDGYVLGLNAFFTITPPSLVERVTQYVNLPEGEEKNAQKDELKHDLVTFFSEHHDAIYAKMKNASDDRRFGPATI